MSWNTLVTGFIFLLVAALSGCGHQKADYNLSDEQLVGIIADMHFAETTAQNAPVQLRDSVVHNFFDQIYQIHKTEQSSVLHDLALLKEDPEKMGAIYEKVLEELKKKEARNK